MIGIAEPATARTTISSLNAQRSSIEPPPRATISRSGRRPAIALKPGDRRGDLLGRALALDRHRPEQDMGREAIVQPVEDVADHRPGRRGDHADHARQERQRLLARRVEQPLGGERAAPLVEQRHQRALPGQLQPLDDDLVARAAGIGGEPAGRDHLDPVLGLEADRRRLAVPDHRVDAGLVVLEREIAMARADALEARNLAAHADMVEASSTVRFSAADNSETEKAGALSPAASVARSPASVKGSSLI